MFDLSWTEILVIGTAALIFIGPKELPGALKTLGQWAAKARSLAGEFRNNIDEMIRESELEKLKTQVDQLSSGNLAQSIEKTVDPKGEISGALATPDMMLGTPPVAPEIPPPAVPADEASKPEAAPVVAETPAKPAA